VSIEELASYCGYDFKDFTGHPNYRDRKGKVYALIDRRNGQAACIYATKQQIKSYLERSDRAKY
jgi:hypothetical protein